MKGENIFFIFIERTPADTHCVCGFLNSHYPFRIQQPLRLHDLQQYLRYGFLFQHKISVFVFHCISYPLSVRNMRTVVCQREIFYHRMRRMARGRFRHVPDGTYYIGENAFSHLQSRQDKDTGETGTANHSAVPVHFHNRRKYAMGTFCCHASRKTRNACFLMFITDSYKAV